MRKVLVLVMLGSAAGLCGCGPGGVVALALLLIPHKESKREFVNLTVWSDYGEPDPAVGTHRFRKDTTITVSCGQTPYPMSDPAGGTRFVCTGWTAVGSDLTSGVEQSFTFTISGDTTINWLWRTEHRLTVKVEPLGAGTVSVSPASGDDYYAEGAGVTLEAQPAAGYSFAYWKGDATGTQNPLTLTMNAPKEVVAVFVPQLQITTTSLPDGYDGQTGYSATLTAIGGTGAYSWSIVSGSLPSGLALEASTGVISGDIAAGTAGTYNFTVEVTDGQQTAQANLSIIVYPQLQITTTSLPDAKEGVAYSYTVSASGGDSANYTWSVSGQPSWLTIDASTGELSGTPPAGSAGIIADNHNIAAGRRGRCCVSCDDTYRDRRRIPLHLERCQQHTADLWAFP